MTAIHLRPRAGSPRRSANFALLAAGIAVLLCSVASVAEAADLSASYVWKPVRIGAGGWMRGMVVHSTDPNVRYARGDVDNFYRWDAARSTWVPLKVVSVMPAVATAVPASNGGGALALDPGNTQVVLVALNITHSSDLQGAFPSLGLGVYRSSDGGRTFAATSLTGLGGSLHNEQQGERLAIDPNNGNIAYFGTLANGLWRSADGGRNWSQVTGSGAPGGGSNARFPRFDQGGGTISVGGQNVSRRIYLTMNAGSVLRSDDGGSSWTNISSGQGVDGRPGFATVDRNGTLWVAQDDDIAGSATICRYARGGSWSTVTAPYSNIHGIAVDPANANRVFTVSQGGALARSTNGGVSWTALGSGPKVSSTQTIEWLRPSSWRPNGHYISLGGIYMAPDGRLWIPGANDGIMTCTPNDATDTAGNPPVWTSDSIGIEEMVAQTSVFPPGGKPVLSVEDEGCFRIQDPDQFNAQHFNLNTWNGNNGLATAQDINYCPNQPRFIVLAADNCFAGDPRSANGKFSGYSTDGGQTWTKFGSTPSMLYCGIIAVSARAAGHENDGPGHDNIVRLGSNMNSPNGTAPYYSKDGGATWTQTTSLGGDNWNGDGLYLGWQCGPWNPALKQHLLESDPLLPGVFYLHTVNNGFWKSTDGGVTWTRLAGNGLPTLPHHGKMIAVPGRSGDLWLVDGHEGASAHGLYHTTDGGVNWSRNSAFDYAWAVTVGKALNSYPTIYVYGKRAGDAQWGMFRSVDAGTNWDRISGYPTGLIDIPSGLAASWDVFGLVYVGLIGNSYVYGQPGTTPVNTPPVAAAQSVATQAGTARPITLGATDANGDTLSYRVVSGPAHGSLSGSAPSLTYTPAAGYAGSDSFTFVANDGRADSNVATVTITVTPVPPSPLPSPWTTQVVGSGGLVGSASYANGAFTVAGSGADIWANADAFRFVNQGWSGDVIITARVVSLQNTDPWAKAGVMVREDMTSGSRHAFACVTPGNGVSFQSRSTAGGASASVPGPRVAAPRWVRLVRIGGTITAYDSADGATWTTVGTLALALNAQVQVGLAVCSHNASVAATAVFNDVSVSAPNPLGMPPGWTTQDVGSVAASGSVSVTGGTWTMAGSGADIWGTSDEFRGAFTPLSGDGSITVRVTSIGNTNPWAKAGVMIRESTAPGARHAFACITPGNGAAFQRRTAVDAASAHTAGSRSTAPRWLRLERVGNQITASESADGAAWTVIGQVSVSLGANALIGLAVTSHADGTRCTATFTNLTVIKAGGGNG